MKMILSALLLITLFTAAYSVPTTLNLQGVKSRDLSTTLAQEPEWTDQSAYFTSNVGHVKQIQSFTSTYDNGRTWTPNQSYLAVANSSKELCIFVHPENAGLASVAPWSPECSLGFKGYLTSSLLWVYTVPAIDSLANSVYFKIRVLRDENARLQYNLDTTKNAFETKVDNAIANLQSGVFSQSLRDKTVKELSEKLQPLVEAEVSRRVTLLQSDPEFIKNVALAVKNLKP